MLADATPLKRPPGTPSFLGEHIGLSETVAAAVPSAVEMICELLRDLVGGGGPRSRAMEVD